MMSVKENLIAAKALIDTPEKWFKGEYESDNGCLCALGAVARAVCPKIDFDEDKIGLYPEDGALAEALPFDWPKEVNEIPDFNDAPETTHADIMALFDRAIAASS